MKKFFLVAVLALLVVPCVSARAQDAVSDDGARAQRLELARKLNDVNPVARQIARSVAGVGAQWAVADPKAFEAGMMKEIDMEKIDEAAEQALADVFTAEELNLMIGYYSAPQAERIAEKMSAYQALIQKPVAAEIDRALMTLRTGAKAAGNSPATP